MVKDFQIKVFADGADLKGIQEMNDKSWVSGFTTNPSLMRKAGVQDYETFAREVLKIVKEKPVSFEVFADDFSEMKEQAREIASWGNNVYVKIPVTNTKKESANPLIEELSHEGIKLNITAVFTLEQVQGVVANLSQDTSSILSIFAGRIADTGVDPVDVMAKAMKIIEKNKKIELLWASPREILNLIQANNIGCHIITMSNDLLNKVSLLNKNLEDYSLETVQMFYHDATAAAYKISCKLLV